MNIINSEPLRVGVVKDYPEAFGCFMNLPTNSCVRPGYEIEIFDSIARKVLHWDYNFVLVDDSDGYGYHNNNGSWTGLLGMIVANRVDVSAVTLRATNERLSFMEFGTFISYFQQVFVIKQPDELNIVTVLSEPFQSYAWLCLLLVFFASSFVFAFGQHFVEFKTERLLFSLKIFASSLWDTFGLVMKQHECRSSSKNRNLLARLLLFAVGLLLGTTYASMLASRLSVPLTRKIPFRSAEELAELMIRKSFTLISPRSGRQPSCFDSVLFEKALRANPIVVEPNKTKFDELVDTGHFVQWTTEDVIAAANEVNVFFSKNNGSVWSSIVPTDNRIMIKDRSSWPTGVAFAFPKKSRYRRRFDEKLRTYLTYASTLKNRYGNIYYEFDPKNRARRVSITIFHYYEIIILFAGGVAVAFVAFLIEHLSSRLIV